MASRSMDRVFAAEYNMGIVTVHSGHLEKSRWLRPGRGHFVQSKLRMRRHTLTLRAIETSVYMMQDTNYPDNEKCHCVCFQNKPWQFFGRLCCCRHPFHGFPPLPELLSLLLQLYLSRLQPVWQLGHLLGTDNRGVGSWTLHGDGRKRERGLRS